MTIARVLETHGDPLGSVRQFLRGLWQSGNFDMLLVPTDEISNSTRKPNITHNADQIENFNPFNPLMSSNTAKHLPEILLNNPGAKIGLVLRPCEFRAVANMIKRNKITAPENLTTICFDCLGTYPTDDYQWRAESKGAGDTLARENIQFARQGGMLHYRYRSTCQTCRSPHAESADINIGIFGLPVRQFILIQASISADAKYRLSSITNGNASDASLQQHQWMAAKIAERNGRVRERIRNGLRDILPENVDALLAQLQACEPCRECLDACPACAFRPPERDLQGNLIKDEVIRWMVDCAGCGMCEQVCTRHLPLGVIFSYVHDQLLDQMVQ
jgi:formate dehydrogenase subunit beta